MIYDVDKYVDFLCKAQISTNQFLMCMLIHLKDYKNTLKYINERGEFNPDEIEDLIERDFIITTNPGSYEIDELLVTPKFTSLVYIDAVEAGEELWDNYPKWLFVDSKKISAKSCDKEELIEKYNKRIKGNIIRHKKILNLLINFKRSNEYAEMGIEKFVASEHWNLLEEDYNSNKDKKYGEDNL